ncbi:MAG: hypothetical protein ACFFG0_00220 [Candidatus Thorarchaeota archaeon]
MKHIIIYQENTSPVVLSDEDESKIEDYSKKASKILESNNVSILHTSQASLIIRPNKITSIVITEYKSHGVSEVGTSEQEQKDSVREEIKEDIITD